MKRLILTIAALALFVGSAYAANEVELNEGTERDSITSITTSYTSVDSLSVTIDDATAEALLFVSGEAYLSHDAVLWLAVCTADTIADGSDVSDTMLIISADTIDADTRHMYSFHPKWGDPDVIIPFSFQQEIDTDSTGQALNVLLKARKDANFTNVKLYNVRMMAIEGLKNDSL